MADRLDLNERYHRAQQQLATYQQTHLLRWWPELGPASRRRLLDQIEALPWSVVEQFSEIQVCAQSQAASVGDLEPATVYPAQPGEAQERLYAEAVQQGRALLRAGSVAAFTVAGGMGSRLGFDGPKGMLPVTPVRKNTLFELFAEMLVAARRRYEAAIPWYIMTGPANHERTVRYFRDQRFFGLPESDVRLFTQGVLPMFDLDGHILLSAKDGIALGPDGHGGSLKALQVSGALADMKRRGIRVLSYFQVDNPLVKPFDPLFLGLHESTGSDMATKAVRKASDEEHVGHICLKNGKLAVVEYSDFPEPLTHERNEDGSRRFDAGNAAIHLLNVDFVERLMTDDYQLPYRCAVKAVSYVDRRGHPQQPSEPNAVKLETFVFDALALAVNPLVLEIDREEEFSPVKNAHGADTLASARRDQVRRACRWLEAAGVKVPLDEEGEPAATIEIAPSFALSAADILEQCAMISPIDPGSERVMA